MLFLKLNRNIYLAKLPEYIIYKVELVEVRKISEVF